jgi:four helix bundle protein
MGGLEDLVVHKKAFALALKVFLLTRKFRKEERYSLVDQVHRSLRSVCANLAEAYRKRRLSHTAFPRSRMRVGNAP